MFNRKKLYRERLEIYLVYALRAYRPFFVLAGVVGLLYSVFILSFEFWVGSILILVSILPLIFAYYEPLIIPSARFIAWFTTLFKKDF